MFEKIRSRLHISTQNKIRHFGLNRYCPVCKSFVRGFLPAASGRKDVFCPVCGARERHRLLWLYMRNETGFLERPLKMLHVAPENCFIRRFRRVHGEGYVHIDIAAKAPENRMDLTHLQFPDSCFDFFYCSHVLEHIEEDEKALSEIYRVLRPGGAALIMVPVFGENTLEDKTVRDPVKRRELYGQSDHVRTYGEDFIMKLRAAGFKADRIVYRDRYPSWLAAYYGLTSEIIFHCVKEAR